MKNIAICAIIILSLAACATTPPTVAELCEDSTLPMLDSATGIKTGAITTRAFNNVRTSNTYVSACVHALERQGLTPEKRRQYSIFLAELHLINEKNPTQALAVLEATANTFGAENSSTDGLAIRAGFLRAVALYHLNRKDEALAVINTLISARPYSADLHDTRLSILHAAKTPDFSMINKAMALDSYNRAEMVLTAEVFGKFEKAISMLDALAVTSTDSQRYAHDLEARLLELFTGQSVDHAFFEKVLEDDHEQYDDLSVALAHTALSYLAYVDGDEEKRHRHFAALNDLPINLSILLTFEKLREAEIVQTGQSFIPAHQTTDLLDQAYNAWSESEDPVFKNHSVISTALSRLPRTIENRKGRGSSAIWMTEEKSTISAYPADVADTTVVEVYTYPDVPGTIVDEMSLLRAAELAKDAGKSHFLIRDIALALQAKGDIQSKSGADAPYFRGYHSSYKITFTDNTPESPYAKAAPFMLSADEIIAELGPRYRN